MIFITIATTLAHAIILNACFDSLYPVILYLLTSYSFMKYVSSMVIMNINASSPFQPLSKEKYLKTKKNAIISIPSKDNASLNAFCPLRFLFFIVIMIIIVTSRITIIINEIIRSVSIFFYFCWFDFFNIIIYSRFSIFCQKGNSFFWVAILIF